MPTVSIVGTRGYPSFYGGFETAVRYLAPFLADRGWDVTVYGRPGAKLDPSVADPRIVARETWGVESRSASTLSFGLSASFDAVRRRPDVALVMNVANGFYLPALKARKIPTLVNVDGIEWERAKWGRAARGMFKAGARMTARFADNLVFDAHAIGDYWKREFSRDGLFIPYGGEVPDMTLPVAPGLESGKYVLYVARFVPENSFHEFLDAVPAVAESHDVVIVGSTGYGGELEDRVESLVSRFPRVRWLGHVSDDARIHSLWQHAGAYFHGHSVGGTNPALVQAMACGSPVVARDTVYNREVLADAGTFVKPEPDAIAAAILEQLNSDSSAKVAAGRKRVDATYNWESVCSAYERGLRDLLK